MLLYDVYLYGGKLHDVFCEQDYTCPYLCLKHLQENEEGCCLHTLLAPSGEGSGWVTYEELASRPVEIEPAGAQRRYREGYHYPHTNRHGAQGFSVYRPLSGRSL